MSNFVAKTAGARGQIYVYDPIGESMFEGGITAKSFSEGMKSLGNVKALDIYVNSPGGSVFEGMAIFSQIKRFAGEKVVHIDGIAASIASIIAMAGDERRIAANGVVMIHDPYGVARGSSAEMRKQAEALDMIRASMLDTYAETTRAKREDISAWMADETWMDAKDALARGFATQITSHKEFRAETAWLQHFAKVPDSLRQTAAIRPTEFDKRFERMNMRLNKPNRGASPAKA